MLIGYRRGQGSIILRVKILNSSVSTGAGLTGLSSTSSGLIISTIADTESTATAYTVAASNVETITTNGTFSAPTAGKCRFKEVDSTNHKGVYEIQIADARFNVSGAKSLLVSVSGATNAAETDVVIPLRDLDPFDAVRAGLTALPNVASGSAGAIITSGTGTAQLSVSTGQVTVATNNDKTGYSLSASQTFSTSGSVGSVVGTVTANTTQLAGQTVTAAAGVTFPSSVASPTNITAGTITTVGTVTNRVTANTDQWGGVAVTGMPMPTYTQPTGFLAATFPTNVASPTNITAGTITTVTNVTNGVTVATNNDKSGYSLSASQTFSTSGSVGGITGVTFPSVVSSLTAANVWQTDVSGYTTAGHAGTYLKGAGSSGDPWSTAIPGAYGVGTAGYILGTNLNATITSRLATSGYTAPLDAAGTRSALGLAAANLDTQLDALPTATENAAAVWNALVASYVVNGSFGERVLRSTNTQAEVQVNGNGHVASVLHSSEANSITVGAFAADSITASALAASAATEIATATLGATVEGSETLVQAVRLVRAALVGKLSGAATTTVTIRDAADSKNRITATVTADGNRTDVTTDAT